MNKAKSKLRKGVTMVEIVIIIAVLALLAVFLVPRIGGVATAATTSQTSHNKKVVNDLLENFVAAGGTIASTATVAGSTSANGTLQGATVTNIVDGLRTGVYAGGMLWQLPPGDFTTTGWTLTAPSTSTTRIAQ